MGASQSGAIEGFECSRIDGLARPLLGAKGSKGYAACAYVDIAAADKFGEELDAARAGELTSPQKARSADLNVSAAPTNCAMSLPGFLSWLEERPGVLGPARLSGAGTTASPRTLVAADDVYEGATLLRVPESRLLSALTAADPLYCRASALFRAANASHFADERVRLAAFLLH